MRRIRLLWALARHLYILMDERNLGLIAAGVAFYAILSVFPGLAALIALWGVFGDPGLAAQQIEAYEAVLPNEVEALFRTQLNALATVDGLTLGWASILSFLLALWTARAGVAALMRGLNAIYGVPNRSGFSHAIRALVLTLSLIGVGFVALVCVVIVPVLVAFFPTGVFAQIGIEAARWSIALGVLATGFALIYRLAPNARAPVWPGALLATLFWAAGSVGFSIYLQNFSTYNEVYGSIGAVVALLMWLLLSAWLVLVGGGINNWLADQGSVPTGRSNSVSDMDQGAETS